MAVDPLSPIAPARIRALLLPVGRIKRSSFLVYVDLLQQQSLVRLGDVSPDPRPDRNMFSPLAFPRGTLLYDLSTSLPSASHLSLSPFEQFREPLLVIGIGDASEYAWLEPSRGSDGVPNGMFGEPSPEDEEATTIQSSIDDLREQFPRAYLHSLMMFESPQARHPLLPQETLLIPPKSRLKTTTMKTFMCDLTATLLAEMTTLAKSIQALPTVVSPASQNGTAENTPSWANSDFTASPFTRRNSQAPSTSRPESPIPNTQKDNYRMSMPVLPSSSGGPLTPEDSRAASPNTQGTRTPPTTFDDISGINAASTLHRTNSNTSRPPTATKDLAADRVSIHGFGSGGVGERARNKGRGRISIVIGALYMCAGQWHEAIRELTEGGTRARAFSDHLWHAKALEHIMVCMLLFAWSGMDFQIPQICQPISDKTTNSKSPQHTPQHTPSSSTADVSAPARSSSNDAALERLNSLLPDLVNMILNLYSRAANFAGESLPPLAFSQCIIRFSKLLTAVNLAAGYLDEDALQSLVRNTPYKQKPRLSAPRLSVHPTRNDIASMLFRALPGPVDASGMKPTDRVVVLAGVASVLASLGLQRKKAIVMKEFITSLIPGLVQARKVGAAEMGVHPAAGLAALNVAGGINPGVGALSLGESEVENGIDEFLGLFGKIYGIPHSRDTIPGVALSNPGEHSADSVLDGASQGVVDAILRISSLRAFGSLGLKLEVLRMCLNFCEALPDFNGVLHFTASLLRVAGPGTAPRPNSTDVFVSLPREEQARLYSNITRTVTASKKLGLHLVETEYWDDFLVRGLFILEESAPLHLTLHRPVELKSTATDKEGPFLHNSWLKKPQTSVADTILVANKEYRFLISLQNPYDFELGVESLKIAAEGVEFTALEEHFLLGPYRTQKFQIVGRARSSGTLRIIGCYVKLIGCRERLFSIFPEPWKPKGEPKMKKIGLKACLGAPMSRPLSTVIAPSTEQKTTTEPRPKSLTFTVIPEQPVVVITDVSLPQSALMVLEGEKKQFTVTVKNTSETTAVDFVHISFHDSATTAIQAATSNKDLPPAELHELEVQLAYHPSFRWCRTIDEESLRIQPGQEMGFTIEIVGRTRLTDAVIQIDYANLGKRRSEVEEQFFTRQVSAPISITVNASVQLQRPDIVPLSRSFGWSHQQSPSTSLPATAAEPGLSTIIPSDEANTHWQPFRSHIQSQRNDDEYCMLILDLRNSWPNPLSVSLEFQRPGTEDEGQEQSRDKAYAVNEVIQPGHVNRIVMVLPKIYLKNPHAAIPYLNPANQRQFVVSTSKISPETERASREAFWYRHELLKLVRGMWKEESNGRHGDLELRGIRFSPRMVEAIKLEDIMIETSITSDYQASGGEGSVRQLSRAKFEVPVNEFLTMKTTIRNRSPHPISPILRLQPHLAGLPHNIALDLDKRFSWTGLLQKKLPIIHPGQSVESELGIVALCSGTFEIGATVGEVELVNPEGEEDGKRAWNETQALMQGNILGERKLRSWHIKEPCVIHASR
ncbi:Trs120-domain-containing protein [Cucurbitaria berberidis CBS 394.84]|uniref:Trs120-domain-containing protein n=1 Tax=Cucurbitaria berberidis CBS 394.84 TaxID=1168544 RepID=A0A9P4GFW5_9PLEO|nr:Trs120-domain-containing protein [Cucurbitaria berberidis CBS 394.84]KAF1844617.1 Trs120-domain-containing protein [Cucurbitaria berberidis CBS 394.84]